MSEEYTSKQHPELEPNLVTAGEVAELVPLIRDLVKRAVAQKEPAFPPKFKPDGRVSVIYRYVGRNRVGLEASLEPKSNPRLEVHAFRFSITDESFGETGFSFVIEEDALDRLGTADPVTVKEFWKLKKTTNLVDRQDSRGNMVELIDQQIDLNVPTEVSAKEFEVLSGALHWLATDRLNGVQ